MSRVQLALNVSNLGEAVEFYSKLFGAEPAKRQPGYANFAITDPPLKLILMEESSTRGHGTGHALNHLGIEVEGSEDVAAAAEQLSRMGLEAEVQDHTTCCFALQDKVWVNDPDGAPWEIYTVLADAATAAGMAGDASCCVPVGTGAAEDPSSCC